MSDDLSLLVEIFAPLVVAAVLLFLLRRPIARWWPWQAKRHWEIGADLPEPYARLLQLTKMFDPYKKKFEFVLVIGSSMILMFDVPGVFFTNPYTHVVEGPAAYLGILGVIVTAAMGAVALWGFQYFKDYEVMQFTFGGFNLRVRKGLRVPFHCIIGTIELVDEKITERVRKMLDEKMDELRILAKVQPLKPQEPINITPPGPDSPAQNPLTTSPAPQSQVETGTKKLNLFYIPMPSLLQKVGIPGVFHFSTADHPEKLQSPLPGEWIWEGWIRHAKGEVWDLGVCAEWPFLYGDRQALVPITAAAGTHYDFTWALERSLSPPKLDSRVIEDAKAIVSARVVGLEAAGQVQMWKDAFLTNKNLQPLHQELAMDTAGNILELIMQRNKIGAQPVERKSKTGNYVGYAILVTALGLVAWLAFHGWHL